MMEIRLLRDSVLVKLDEPDEVTKGGIIISDNARDRAWKGEVVSIGQGTDDSPMELKVGDKVLVHPYDGIEMTIDHKSYIYLNHEEDIIGKI
jgi:chaperonin GroES